MNTNKRVEKMLGLSFVYMQSVLITFFRAKFAGSRLHIFNVEFLVHQQIVHASSRPQLGFMNSYPK